MPVCRMRTEKIRIISTYIEMFLILEEKNRKRTQIFYIYFGNCGFRRKWFGATWKVWYNFHKKCMMKYRKYNEVIFTKKQFAKMKFKAVLKIVIPIALMALIIFMFVKEDLETYIAVIVGGLWGIAALIYIISGILTLKNGPKQAMQYIKKYPGGDVALTEEFEVSEKFGWLNIGPKHVFADASDGFYIIPYEKIEDIYVRHEGANPAKGRSGYYYLYIKCGEIGGFDERVKVYYMLKSEAQDALACLEGNLDKSRLCD